MLRHPFQGNLCQLIAEQVKLQEHAVLNPAAPEENLHHLGYLKR